MQCYCTCVSIWDSEDGLWVLHWWSFGELDTGLVGNGEQRA